MQSADQVTAAKKGDADAFGELFSEYHNNLYYFVLNHVKNPSDAEDIVQETFIEAFSGIHSLSESRAFKSWLYTIAYRQSVKAFRKGSRSVPVADMAFEEAAEFIEGDIEFLPEHVMETKETRSAVAELVMKLPDAQKTAILLYYFEDLDLGEIAKIEDCPIGTIKSRLNYARKAIKSKVEESRKMGIPILAAAPLPLLTSILREAAELSRMPEAAAGRIMEAVTLSIAGTAAGGVGISAGAGASAKVGIAAATKAVIASVAAVVVTAGVIVGIVLPNMRSTSRIPMPVTDSDYAKMYYLYVQDVLIPSGRLIDADMFDFTGDGKPEMITSELLEGNENADTCTAVYHIVDEDGAAVLRYVLIPHQVELMLRDAQAVSSHYYFIGSVNGRSTLMRLNESLYYSPETNDWPIETKLTELYIFTAEHTPPVIIVISAYTEVETGETSYSASIHNQTETSFGDMIHDHGAVKYEEAALLLEQYLIPQSTWGFAVIGDPPFPIENTNGERLRNYFGD